MTIYSLDGLLSYLEPVCCSMSSSNCCFLTCIQISPDAGQVVWYSHLFQNFPLFIVIHTVKGFGIVNKAEINIFLELSCFFSRVQLFVSPWMAARKASLSITNSWSLHIFMFIELVMPSNHLILCYLLLLLPSIFPNIRVFQMSQLFASGGQSIGVSASISVLSMNSFRMDCLNLLAVQGILKSLLQHHSSKASILWCLAFFIVQLSHPYMTTALTRQTFFGKVLSLLFNMLSRLVMTLLPGVSVF